MRFIIVLIALLIERFFDWSHLRQWHWYTALQKMVSERLPGKNAYLIVAMTILPLLLLVFIIDYVLSQVLYGVLSVVFELCLLLYCFGPRNLWADAFASATAFSQNDSQLAKEKLYDLFGVTDAGRSAFFIEANRRVFAIVFWFAILGPIGAVLYRALAISSRSTQTDLSHSATYAASILDWIPARIFTFALALGGHFAKVFDCWRKKVGHGFNENDALLVECGAAALGQEDVEPLERRAVSLIDRAFVIMLVFILLVMLLV